MKNKQWLTGVVVLIIAIACLSFSASKKNVQLVKINWLDSVFHIQNDTTYVLNFWATWCIPCVAELPAFEKINRTYSGQKVRVILVSLDYAKKVNETVVPFLERKKIESKVVLLNESDANSWIDKVDESWSGAIPATLIVNKSASYRSFLEKELNFEMLDSIIKISLLNK